MSGTALDSWEVENPVPSLEGGAEAGQGTDGSGVIMFNNYTKGEVEGKLAGNDIRNEDETQARTRSNIQKRKARGSDMGSSKPSSAASRTRRHQSGDPSRPQSSNSMVNFSSDEPVPDANSSTATKRPRRKKRRRRKHDKGEKMHNNKPNRKSAKLLSVNDMFKLGFGKQHSGHLNAHRGHTPRKTSGYTLAEAGPGTRVFALTGTPRLGKETLVDTLLDFPIPDPRERPRTVSPRTRKAREAQWNKMREDAEMIRRAVSRGTRRSSLASAGGADDGRATTAGSMNPEDPAVTLLKEKQASEDREIKEALASSMGLTVEEMDALDASANADTEDAINEYLEAFHRIDADGSGSLSPEELKSVMNELGEDMNEAELEEMIREADTDGDGEIDYDEFTGMMRARKRRELLARNMTKAQAGHRKNSSRGHRTLQHSERKSIIPEVNDGSAMLAQFEEMTGTRQSYPQGGAPSLPPLQLSKATIAKRHIRNGAVASSQFMDRFLTRPTPHVLKTGAAASADKLRIQLTKAQDIIHMLDKKVEEGIEWVQQNCPVTNIKAQLYCQKWGLEKLTELFNKIAYRQMIAAIEKWCEFVDYHVNQEKAENYLKFKGSRRLVKMLEDFDLKQKAGGWDKWVHVMLAERQLEQNKAATDINRVVRGFLGRRRVLNICTGRAAIEIQRVARGRMGRNRYKKIWQEHREEWAAMVIQVRYRGYKGKQLGKIIMKKKREYDAACVLQRAWRGFEGRRITRLIAQKKKELEAVLYIQGAWRSRVARKLVATMRAAIAEEESALYIQAWWRAVLGYREGQARLIAHRTQVAREEAALKIQGAWRIFAARKKVEHARLVRACLRVQCAWRCKKGRFTLHLKRAAKKELEREEAEAASKMQSLFRGRNARRRIAQQKEEANAATTIQGRFRSRMAKKTLAQKRYQAEQSRKRSEQRALEDRMALRIQCAWRGKQGRLGAHLRAQAQKARDEEEAKAAQAIQARIRGRLTRKEIREADEKRRKEAEAAIQQAKRDKAKATEEAHAAQLIQARFRGQQARSEIDELRAAKALEDQRKFEDEMAAEQRKKEAEEQAAKEAAMKKQLELLKKQKEQEEAEQAHAAVMIQQRIRARAAQNELQKRKEQHALELAAETDAAARAKLRERQQREIAAVKLQQQFRSRHARKEVAARRAKLEADKRRLAAEALRHKQDLAALKIQGMARRWQARRDMKKKLDDRQKEIEAKLKAEQEAVEQVSSHLFHNYHKIVWIKITSCKYILVQTHAHMHFCPHLFLYPHLFICKWKFHRSMLLLYSRNECVSCKPKNL